MTEEADAPSQEEEVKEEFANLAKYARGNKVDKVLASCEALLKLIPGDPLVLKTKIVALARKGKFDEALEIAGGNTELMPEAMQGYAAYRQGRLSDARELADDSDLGKHVQAQVAYKSGNYGEAKRIYDGMDSGSAELLVNRTAATTLAEAQNPELDKDEDLLDACFKYPGRNHQELYFNASLLAAQRGDDRAREALATAEEYGANPRDCAAQGAYLDVAAGLPDEAKEKCKALLSSLAPTNDRGAAFCAANTLFAARKPGEDVFDSHKRLKPFVQDCLHKDDDEMAKQKAKNRKKPQLQPLESQRRIFVLNWARLLFDMGKPDDCYEVLRKELATTSEQWDATRADVVALMAASKKKGSSGKGKKPSDEEVAARILDAASEDDAWRTQPRLACCVAQVYLNQGDLLKAADALKDAFTPGTISARAGLLEAAGDLDGAKAALDTLEYKPTDRRNRILLAAHWLRAGEPAKGVEILEHSATKSEEFETAVRAVLYSFYDAEKAEKTLETLPDRDIIPDDEFDNHEAAEKLMELPPPRPAWASTARYRSIAEQDKRLEQVDEQPTDKKRTKTKAAIQRRRDKKRIAYLEKLTARGDYDPQNPPKPDPERWLPKKLRSYNKRGKKNQQKWQQQKMSGAQGVDATLNQKEIAKLDVASRVRNEEPDEEKESHLKKLPPKLNGGRGKGPRKKRGG